MIGFAERATDTRLLTFEVGGQLYALPISAVLEVAEAGDLCGVPGLSREESMVMNWHGDALPLVSTRRLVESPAPAADGAQAVSADVDDAGAEAAESLVKEHVLVLSDRGGEAPCLGLPIDGVRGIVVGSTRSARPMNEIVVERRPVDGRLVSVLDPRRLVERAQETIDRMAA